MKNIKPQTWFSAGCLLGCALMLFVGAAAPPKYVAGGGTNKFLAKWTAGGAITNSLLYHLTDYRIGIGDESAAFINTKANGRAVGWGYNSVTNAANLSDVTGVGFNALRQASGAAFLVGVGDDALGKNTTGTRNTGLGSQAGFETIDATDLTAVGFQCFASVTRSNFNTGLGSKAGLSARGQGNTLVGTSAFQSMEQGVENVGVGYTSDINFTGDPNSSNVVVGARAFATAQSVVVGHGANSAEQSQFNTLVGTSANAGTSTNAGGFGWNSRAFADNMIRIGNNLTEKTVTTGRYEATNSFASYSTLATNQIPTTGWTNDAAINVTVYTTATAVSFTVNNRAGTVIYTSPTLTATVPVTLQPGWSVRAASGLTGTVLPW